MIPYLKTIPIQTIEIFDYQDNSIGTANVFEFNDFLIQLQKYPTDGYYFMWKGEKVEIGKDGRMTKMPEGCFDLFEKQMTEFMGF